MTWAVSQGSPVRRSVIERDLHLSDKDGFSSGGFIADVRVQGRLDLGSQQQWFFRNLDIQGGLDCPAGWNYVFAGVNGLSDELLTHCRGDTTGKVTVTEEMPRVAEKPYLVREDDGMTWQIYVPAFSGRSWSGSITNYEASTLRKLAIEVDVFVATSQHSAADINRGIVEKRGLLLTPGIYRLAEPIVISTDGFVVLGLGFPTLIALLGEPALKVANDVADVRIAGVLLEAGTPKGTAATAALLQWGQRPAFQNSALHGSHFSRRLGAGDVPSGVLSDVFARVGSFQYQGCPVVRADTMLEINSDDVIVDNAWLWHADHDDCGTDPEHGLYGKSDDCHSAHGLVVNGRRVTAYGISSEHTVAGDNVLWNGEDGETHFYQAELPYHNKDFGQMGYSGYTVAPFVKTHRASGLGVYIIGNGLDVRSAFLFTPTVQASNLVSVVIKGRPEQFESIACDVAAMRFATHRKTAGESAASWPHCRPYLRRLQRPRCRRRRRRHRHR